MSKNKKKKKKKNKKLLSGIRTTYLGENPTILLEKRRSLV